MVEPVSAVEHIRRMRGGAQSHLLRCSDGEYYVVKFQNNPQGTKILANEFLGSALAARLGLPSPEFAVVNVCEDLIRNTEEMVVQLGRRQVPCTPGLCFGSRYPSELNPFGRTALRSVYNLMPETLLPRIANPDDFAGMLVFDKWTCNCDGRQVIYAETDAVNVYKALMIDNGFCFNAHEWNFPDSPLRGLYCREIVYSSVRGMESFEPWLERLAKNIDRSLFGQLGNDIPPEWFGNDMAAIEGLLDQLERRRNRVSELLLSAWRNCPSKFVNWPYQAPKFLIRFPTRLPEQGKRKAKGA